MPASASSAPPKDLDYILDNLVGGGGRWQWTKMMFLLPVYVAMGAPLLLHMFTAYTPDHRCFIPGCDNDGNNATTFAVGAFATEKYLKFALPKDTGGEGTFLK